MFNKYTLIIWLKKTAETIMQFSHRTCSPDSHRILIDYRHNLCSPLQIFRSLKNQKFQFLTSNFDWEEQNMIFYVFFSSQFSVKNILKPISETREYEMLKLFANLFRCFFIFSQKTPSLFCFMMNPFPTNIKILKLPSKWAISTATPLPWKLYGYTVRTAPKNCRTVTGRQ